MKNLRALLLTDLLENYPIKNVSTSLGNNEQVALEVDERAKNENAPRGSGAAGQQENRKGIFAIYEILSDLGIRIIFPTLYHVSDLLPKWLANTFFTRKV